MVRGNPSSCLEDTLTAHKYSSSLINNSKSQYHGFRMKCALRFLSLLPMALMTNAVRSQAVVETRTPRWTFQRLSTFIRELEKIDRSPMDESTCEKIIASLRSRNVEAVVFDFDCTISLFHSGGRVRKDKFAQFLHDNISPCFRDLLPRLLNADFKVGVATFADSYKAPPTYIAGEDMIRAFFQHHFGQEFRDIIPIIAAYPENYQIEEAFKSMGLSAPMPMFKEYHLQRLSQLWKLEKGQIALVDDDEANVKAARAGGYAVRHVRQARGVSSDDMLA